MYVYASICVHSCICIHTHMWMYVFQVIPAALLHHLHIYWSPWTAFAHFVKAVYRNISVAADNKVYPIPTSTYTNLAVVEKEVNRAEADKFTRATLHGGLDEIMKVKKPIFLEDVFKPEKGQESVKCVLAEGAPGVGKSTFALELCRKWDTIKLMRKFVAVVLLRLREKRVQEARCVADLFYHDDPDVQQAVGKQVRLNSGENVLLVLDGFDELPVHLRNSFFLGEVIRGKCLPSATILVTSRPSARADLNSLCSKPDKQIEVLGFTSELVDQYAESVYGGYTPLLADFRLYINANPAIKSMMYIPLNSAIVVEIYRENREVGKPIPQTETQLYTELTLIRIRSYLREQHNQSIESLPVELEDLPQGVRDQLCSLAKLAFKGTVDKEVIFPSLPAGCTTLGLMTASQELYIRKRGAVNYNFFHLTYQEFLTAFHISQLPPSEQKALFLQCLDEGDPPKMSVVWRFVAGMTGFPDIGWDKYLRLINGEVVVVEGKEEEVVKQDEEWKEAEKVVKQKDDHSQIVTPFLAQCLYEAQEVDCAMTLGRSGIRFNGRRNCSPFECFVVGYCVAASRCEWRVDLSHSGLGTEMVEMLGCGLRSREDVCGYIGTLDLSANPIGQEGVVHFKALPHKVLQGICTLTVSDCELYRSALDLLSSLVPIMTSLKELDISRNPAGDGGTVKVLKALSDVNQLYSLAMYSIPIGCNDVMALSSLIQPSVGSLKELWIGDRMSQEDVGLMVENVLSRSSLENLTIVNTDLTSCSFAPVEENHNLIKLVLQYCTLDNEVVAKALHRNTALRELCLRYSSSFKSPVDDGVLALSGMLRNNRSLKMMEVVILGDVGREAVRALSGVLKDNRTLERLQLYSDYRGLFSDTELDEMDPRVKFIRI